MLSESEHPGINAFTVEYVYAVVANACDKGIDAATLQPR